jgi:hypothetical protein
MMRAVRQRPGVARKEARVLPNMLKKRAAVVIGVNKTGGLPILEACAAGAADVARWLEEEGFDVNLLTDVKDGKVSCAMVSEAIRGFVSKGTYQQLVLFFSGHGFWKNETELWLLSDAPNDANEAISWIETAEYAKDCGIPNVVLISDACRSIPNTKAATRVRGSVVFPNEDHPGSRGKVDKFMAAAIGTAAFEVKLPLSERKTGIFTFCLLETFRNPEADIVHEITEEGQRIAVVSNRSLGISLQRRVPKMLQMLDATLEQEPDAEVLSDGDAYIGRARHAAFSDYLNMAPRGGPRFNMRDVASTRIREQLDDQFSLPSHNLRSIKNLARASGFDDAVAKADNLANAPSLQVETGFAIVGSDVTDVAGLRAARQSGPDQGSDSAVDVVSVELVGPAASVALRFANGRGAVLAALRGFVAHVTINGNAISSVRYVPSANSRHRYEYDRRRGRIERLRATTEVAATRGLFRLPERNEAQKFADAARIEKGLDPSLGIYAAYALSQADNREDLDDLFGYMQEDLSAEIFDVALLARKLPSGNPDWRCVVPFCPLLTQGWNLLRSRGVQLLPFLDNAEDDLEPGLWTTFQPDRIDTILNAMRN